jgi:hypothetical protein
MSTKMTLFREKARWAKNGITLGQANITGMPPDKRVNKAVELAYRYLI